MRKSTEPAIKSYFFGKGYRDLKAIIIESWNRNLDSSKDFFTKGESTGEAIFWKGAGISVVVFGTIFFLIISLLHITLLGLVFLLIYIGFTIVWGIERIYLFIQGFFSACPHCHEKTLLPEYICNKCGEIHTKLMPNQYGIISHTCQCGQKLPATFFLDRGKLQARCQECHQLLHREHVESRRVFIPILGGPSAGKTVFMFAVVRKLIEEKAAKMGFKTAFVDSNTEKEYKRIIEQLNKGNVPTKTPVTIPKAFNLKLTKDGKTKLVLYIYDPAGEAFEKTQELSTHQYFGYLSGMVMLIDPFSIPAVRRDYENDLSRTWSNINPSQLNLEDALSGVLLTLEESFGLSKTGKIKKPLAVVISKVDAFGLEKLIGDTAVKSGVNKSNTIRQQLIDWDEAALVQQIETRFSNVQYFSCSALGRIPDSTSNDFVSQYVFEPISWLLEPVTNKKSGYNIPTLWIIGSFIVLIILGGFWFFTDDKPSIGNSDIQVEPKEQQNVTQYIPQKQEDTLQKLQVPESQSLIISEKITPIQFIQSYYNEINKGNIDLVIHQWFNPKEEKLKVLIENSEWVKLNKIELINQDDIDAKFSVDVSGKSKDYSTEQRWKGIVKLKNVEGEWKIFQMRLRNLAVIYKDNNIYHIGDEEIKGWKALHEGKECYTAKFSVSSGIKTLALKLDIWNSGGNSNTVFLNNNKVSTLSYQKPQTKIWNEEKIILPINKLQSNIDNKLKICSGIMKKNDKDDLQIRKIKLIAE